MKSSSKLKNKILKIEKNSFWNKIRSEKKKSETAKYSEMDSKAFKVVLIWISHRSLETLGGMLKAPPWLFIKKKMLVRQLNLRVHLAEEP